MLFIMNFNILLTGVGGEGVLTSQVILARAANLEGYFVRGVQLHGLAQRGGSIPTMVRFGDEKEISSPAIMQTDANLVMAFEPLEAVRATYYARSKISSGVERKEKTTFVLDDTPYIPTYSHLLNIPYPTLDEIKERIEPFAKEIHIISARKVALEKLSDDIFGNNVLLGAAHKLGLIPLKKESIMEAIKSSAPRDLEKNLEAFDL